MPSEEWCNASGESPYRPRNGPCSQFESDRGSRRRSLGAGALSALERANQALKRQIRRHFDRLHRGFASWRGAAVDTFCHTESGSHHT